MNKRLFIILLLALSFPFSKATASHIVGGEFTYRYLGDTMLRGKKVLKYRVNLTIYQDCLNGQPTAILDDNPAFLSIYKGSGEFYQNDTDIFLSSKITVPANFSNACVTNIPQTCLLKTTFFKTYYLDPSSTGYVVSYQRCCRNNAIQNIRNAGDNGSTYYCTIPPTIIVNNSAEFKNFPPQIICLNEPLFYDHSATDYDKDSLSYEFCAAYLGASSTNIKPYFPLPPPYDSVEYLAPFTAKQPFTGFPALRIDPITGMITGTPNRTGIYLVTVCCNEWRYGQIINTTKREFQFVITNCSKVVVANIPQYSTDPNTYIVNCIDFKVNFENISSGGFTWHWDFGIPELSDDTSGVKNPTFTYPDTGTFAVKLRVNPRSTCPDSITRLVKIYPKFRADFEDTGKHCSGAPVQFVDLSSASIKPITSWLWNFGDGDSTFDQNPIHTYVHGGTYNVVLMSRNIKNCVDTMVRKVTVQNFMPFAGSDTMIVKEESINFSASGGTEYRWRPLSNLSDTTIYNPSAYYPDTGVFTYYLHVKSRFGCEGEDTVNVTVVNKADFFVPTAFTPNGDGLNDVFRPLAVGYRGLNFFRVFNRFGEVVYYSKNLESGWDGSYKGQLCEMGTYFWHISFVDRFGKTGNMKGDVTLIR